MKYSFVFPNANSMKIIIFKGNTQNLPKIDHPALKVHKEVFHIY